MGNGTDLTAGQILELGSAVLQHLPVKKLTRKECDYWIGHKTELGLALEKVLITQRAVSVLSPKMPNKALRDLGKREFWQEMWKFLDWEFDPSGLIVPRDQEGFGWLIGMPKGMTDNKSFELNAGSFKCSRWTDDLDSAITHNDRSALNAPYFVRVRNRIEADKELKGLSAEVLWERSVAGITHAEREILEQAVWLVSARHLDIEYMTLCHGSRYSGGHVPGVNWDSGYAKLRVSWFSPDDAGDFLRSRQAVSN